MYLSTEIWVGVGLWVGAIAATALLQWRLRLPVVGLSLGYLLNISISHLPGAAVHALPWYLARDPLTVGAGFQLSVYGVLMFAFGAVIVAPLLRLLLAGVVKAQPVVTNEPPGLPRLYAAVGLISSLVLAPLLSGLPTITALVSATSQLLVVGAALGCWHAHRRSDRRGLLLWLLFACLLPLQTLLLQGFLSFGITALASVLLFVASFALRPRLLPLIPLALFLGLSLFVTYMRDRSEIRDAVWGAEALATRADRVGGSLASFTWFDPRDQAQLASIDSRLNQNLLVGVAAYNFANGLRVHADGRTIADAVIALVPRALWPDKPVRAGSGTVVTEYTGIEFDRFTSVGVGQVLEFYINFGLPGVLVGFLLLGTVVGSFDLIAGRALREGRWRTFLCWYLAGLGLLQAGGSLTEIVATVAAGFVVALLVVQAIALLHGGPAGLATPPAHAPGGD